MEKGEGPEARIEGRLREWAAELERLRARADEAVAGTRKEYYARLDALRKEIEAELGTWSRTVAGPEARPGSADAGARSLVERLHARIQAELQRGRPLIDDLRARAEQAEKEARRLAEEWRAKREPARAALGELRTGVERAWGELKTAFDEAIAKFREPSS
jgi:hypothetical protein